LQQSKAQRNLSVSLKKRYRALPGQQNGEHVLDLRHSSQLIEIV
jgi:hypothetical protein